MTHAKRGFPSTRWTLVLRAAGKPTPESRGALEELCRAYRRPLLEFARYVSPKRAEDLVQQFFANVVEQLELEKPNVIDDANPARGHFRSLVRDAFRKFAYNQHDRAVTWKAGGRAQHVDADGLEIASSFPLADRLYDRAWGQALLDRALSRLAEEEARAGRGALFEALRERLTDDDGDRLREVGERLGMTENHVKVSLHRLWKRYGKALRAEVAETVARPEDVEAELHHLRDSWIDDDLA